MVKPPYVVIADDLSGATELAAMASQLGLVADVQRAFRGDARVQLIAMDARSRSLPVHQAAELIRQATRAVLDCHPGFVYKKIDSVLRGHVLAEIRAMLDVARLSRALVISANPSRRRIIRHSRYFIDGQTLDASVFARDPEFPARTADVLELIGAQNDPEVVSLRLGESVPPRGIVIPDVSSQADLDAWSIHVDDQTLPVGGVEFFAALLKARGLASNLPTMEPAQVPFPTTTLYVCGSPAAWDHGRGQQCATNGIPVVPMPDGVFAGNETPDAVASWTHALGEALEGGRRAMAAIGRPSPQTFQGNSSRLCAALARAVAPHCA